MKNSKVIIIAIIIAVIFGVVFLVLAGSEDPIADRATTTSEQSDDNSSESASTVEPQDAAQDINPQGYQDYSSEVVAQTQDKKVLFFHAAWCPTCKALDQNIRAGTVPAGLTIFKVNYDTENALKKKHGVTYQHTLVQIDDSGDQLHKWAGSYTIDQIVDETI